MTNKTADEFIVENAPEGNYKSVKMLNDKPAIWVPENYRSLADITELVELRRKNAELEKDIGFLQSCVNSGETATKSDRPSERAKQLKEQGNE